MRYLLFAFAMFASSISFADSSGLDEKAMMKLSESFMGLVSAGKYREAYNSMKAHWLLPSHEIEQLIYQTEQQLPMISSRYGKSIGYERINTEYIGKSLVKEIYIQKFEKHALAWLLFYYKPDDQWLVNAVAFSDDIYSLRN